MTVSTGERAMLPYWLNHCISDIGANYRRMYVSSPPQPSSLLEVSDVEKAIRTPHHEMKCGVCFDRVKTIAFIPCAQFSERLNRCPEYRKDVIQKTKIYL